MHSPSPSPLPGFFLRSAMAPGLFFLLISVALAYSASLLRGAAAEAPPVAQHCMGDFDKVTSCLDFVQGNGAAPTKQCCGAVGEIRQSDPACLCFFIEQIHNGSSPVIKSMNIQESRLLRLPSACNLKNSSISDCPKILGIPPSSPDYAIFTNASTSTAAPVTAGTGASSSVPVADGNQSSGITHKCTSSPVIILATVLLVLFPQWFEL